MQIARVAVCGAGTMGSGIAQVVAQSGREVVLIDVAEAAVKGGIERIGQGLSRQVAKGALTEGERAAVLGRIRGTSALEEAAGADLVIEAVVEEREAKAALCRRLDEVMKPEAFLASNTSSISITWLGAQVRDPSRVVGMHFFNPVPVMKLVEVVRGLATSDAAYDTVHRLALDLGKTPVTVQDAAGFVSNRVLMPMINEAVFCLMEGVASADDIDTVMRLGMAHPMGPLALADLIGLDVCLSILEVLHTELGDDKYRPCPLLRKMVAAGRLGRKSGQGFFPYGAN